MDYSFEEQAAAEGIPLTDTIDHAILMHRDAHFSGNFEFMLDYYQKDGKGVCPDFEIARIIELQAAEKRLKQNLAAVLLSGSEAERIGASKKAYKKLRSLYEKNPDSQDPKFLYPRLLADLILSEEEEPRAEMAAIVALKGSLVPALVELIRSEDYYDPLFPGYGHAPLLATECLAQIGDKRAIIALFELIGAHDFFQEDVALDALAKIGDPAKEFLLTVLQGKPLTYDNERAAMALAHFEADPQVSEACFNMLATIDFKKHPLLTEHLVLACEGLRDPLLRNQFLALAKAPGMPPMISQDIKLIGQHWQQNKNAN